MRKLVTLLAVAASLVLPLAAASSPASAAERTCYSPHVAGFDTIESCIFLPIELTQ